MSNTEILAHAAETFPAALLALLSNLAEAPRPMPSVTTPYDSGTQFGYDAPLIHIEGGHGEDTIEYFLTIVPNAPDALTIGRVPCWPNGDREITVALDDPAIHGRVLWLTNWTLSPLAVDLPCWGTPEEKARSRAELE